MVYHSLNKQKVFDNYDIKEMATVPKYNFLPRFFDTIICHYRVLLPDGWVSVSKADFYKIRRQRYAMWKMGL